MNLSQFFAPSPQVTKEGGSFQQPTGPTTTGSGVKKPNLPSPQVVPAGGVLPDSGAPMAQRSNTWTDLDQSDAPPQQGRKIDPWSEQTKRDALPPMSAEAMAQIAARAMSLANYDGMITRMREKLCPKPWSCIVGGAMGSGVGAGTTGVGNVHSGRCLLEGVHNPTSAPVTFAIADAGSGDPIPKFSTTLSPGQTVSVGPTGLLFERGVALIVASGTFVVFGRSLD
jgi:hypothetical protein